MRPHKDQVTHSVKNPSYAIFSTPDDHQHHHMDVVNKLH